MSAKLCYVLRFWGTGSGWEEWAQKRVHDGLDCTSMGFATSTIDKSQKFEVCLPARVTNNVEGEPEKAKSCS